MGDDIRDGCPKSLLGTIKYIYWQIEPSRRADSGEGRLGYMVWEELLCISRLVQFILP